MITKSILSINRMHKKNKKKTFKKKTLKSIKQNSHLSGGHGVLSHRDIRLLCTLQRLQHVIDPKCKKHAIYSTLQCNPSNLKLALF